MTSSSATSPSALPRATWRGRAGGASGGQFALAGGLGQGALFGEALLAGSLHLARTLALGLARGCQLDLALCRDCGLALPRQFRGLALAAHLRGGFGGTALLAFHGFALSLCYRLALLRLQALFGAALLGVTFDGDLLPLLLLARGALLRLPAVPGFHP